MRETLNRSLLTEAKWTGKGLKICIQKNVTEFLKFYFSKMIDKVERNRNN